MGHGLEHGIIELDRAWNKDGGVRGLGRHSGRRLGGRGGVVAGSGRRGALSWFIFKIVRLDRYSPLGREGSV